MSVNFGEAELPDAPPVVIEIEVPAEFDIESLSAGLVVPIPTLPVLVMRNFSLAFTIV